MDANTAKLLQAVDAFLQSPAKGTPQPVVEGLQKLSKGLRGGPQGEESPGQRAVREVGADPQPRNITNMDEAPVSPGKREALQAANQSKNE